MAGPPAPLSGPEEAISKEDIVYEDMRVEGRKYQTTVTLDCMDGQEFAGEVMSNAKEAKLSAAQQVLVFYQEQISQMVDSLLEDVGLLHVKDTKIGGANVRGISGGQRRRVTLARGLASDAHVIYCDEPTSGLSATDAELCMKTLRLLRPGVSTRVRARKEEMRSPCSNSSSKRPRRKRRRLTPTRTRRKRSLTRASPI